MRFSFPRRDHIRELADKPAMAVDLGFAKERRTCGLTWQISGGKPSTACVTFGRCIDKVAAFLSEHKDPVLIVEASLSGLFDGAGNPKPRSSFESARVDGRSLQRYWYVGPGAAVSLGAIYFFSRLTDLTMQTFGTINVIEGFVSFKTQRSDHHVQDALALLGGLRDPEDATFYCTEQGDPDERTVNLLGLAGLVSPEEPCPTIMVRNVEDLNQRPPRHERG